MAKEDHCTRRFLKFTFKILQIVTSFVFVYTLLITFILPLILLLIYRFILNLIFKVFYKGRYKLLESENGIHAPNFPNSVYTIYSFLFIEGPCDIPWLRQRIYKIFTETKKPNGSYPYERMMCKIVNKFGFYCWEHDENFDISNHIRLLPGCSDLNKIYTEKEVFEAAARITDTPWEESRPRWEFIVVPQVRREGTGEVCSLIHKRVQHAYADGVSVGALVTQCIGDQPSPQYILDPVNPVFKTPLHLKLMMYLQVFLLGPSVLLRFALHKERHIFYEGPLKGRKYFARSTNLSLPLEEMRRLRKHYKTSTASIQHCAVTGALLTYAERRGLPVPESILGAIVTALVPYPDYYLHNRFMMFLERFPVGEKDPLKRLFKIDKICKKIWSPTSYYIALTSRVLNRITGILPVKLIEKLVVLIQLSYCLSNTTGLKGRVFMNGTPMKSVIGVGPLLNGMRFVVGASCYDQTFEFLFHTEKSQLIKSEDDLMELITDFENEMNFLLAHASL